jgi:acetoin utilization deacetylase AcuC-like enzyme
MLIVAGPCGASAHDGGAAHPEQQSRIFSVMDGVRDLHLEDAITYVGSPEAELEALARVHTTKYLDELEDFCRQGGGDIDPDTYARSDSFTAARRAAGAGLEAIRALERQGEGVAFVPVRPPGHHAETDRAMGFCLLNNVAVSAAALAAKGQRVLIVDWDVHHGNGTQSIFWDDPRVLYVSMHQWPLFPGTGKAQEVGGPNAVGLTVNLPLPRRRDRRRRPPGIRAGRAPGDRWLCAGLGPGVVWLRCPSG